MNRQLCLFFFSSRRRHTRFKCDWSSDVCSSDLFAQGLLEGPHYTRPEVFEGRSVPPVLLSGDHADIRRWRLAQAVARTVERRPDVLADAQLAPEARRALDEFQAGASSDAGARTRGDKPRSR